MKSYSNVALSVLDQKFDELTKTPHNSDANEEMEKLLKEYEIRGVLIPTERDIKLPNNTKKLTKKWWQFWK